jgi:hypothetical protein
VQYSYAIALSVHALAAVFWAGTSFALARTGGVGAELLIRPQIGAVAITILSGGYLWSLVHAGVFGRMEQILAIGILCALVTAGTQVLAAWRAGKHLTENAANGSGAGAQIVTVQRIAAGLLVVTTVSMVVARYI